MHCSNCGAELEEDAAFCGKCGARTQGFEDTSSQDDAWRTSVIAEADVFEGVRLKSGTPQFDPAFSLSQSNPGYTSAMNPGAGSPQEHPDAYGQSAPYANSNPNMYASSPAAQGVPYTQQAPQGIPTVPLEHQTTAMPTQPVPAEKQKASPLKIIVITAVICALIVLAAVVGMLVIKQMQANENKHAMTEVQFAFSYSGDAANEPVGVPLLVEGTDLDGNHAEQQILATASGGTLEFLAGSYTISVDGYPASTSGVVYEVQGENARALEIPEPNEDGTMPQAVIPDLNYSFTPIPADKVTDHDIEEIEKWMTVYGVEPDEIKRAVAAITERRNAEVARISLEQEKQAALDSNPSSVPGTNQHAAPAAQLTGTVCVEYHSAGIPGGEGGNVCYLQLPKNVLLTGTQYDFSENKVILPESLSSYKGQVVTISSHYSGRPTGSIKEAAVSSIWAYDATVVRTF